MDELNYFNQQNYQTGYPPTNVPYSSDPFAITAFRTGFHIYEKEIGSAISVNKQKEIETVKTNAQIQRNALGLDIRSSNGHLTLCHERIGLPDLRTELLSAEPQISFIYESDAISQKILSISWTFSDNRQLEMNLPDTQWEGHFLSQKMNAAGISLKATRNRKLIYDRLLAYLIDHAVHMPCPCRYGWWNSPNGFIRIPKDKKIMEDYIHEHH